MRHANLVIRQRILFLVLIFGILSFMVLFWKLWQIQIVKHDFYAEKALNGQTRDLAVSANRGKITDSKGNLLAISASVHNVVISPKDIVEEELDKDLIATGLATIMEMDRDVIMKRMENTKSQYTIITSKIEADKEQEVGNLL